MPMMRPHAEVTGTVAARPTIRQTPAAGSSDPFAAPMRCRRRRGAAALVEMAAQQERVEQAERGQQDQRPEAERDERGDQHRATGRGLLDREAREELRPLREAPPRDDRAHGRRGGHAGRPVAPAEHEGDRGSTGERREDHCDEPGSARQPIPDPARVVVDDSQADDGRGTGDDGHAECPLAERLLQLGLADAHRVGREVDRGQIRRCRDGDPAEGDRGRVEPARDEIALGVADGHAPRGDSADHGAESEGREDRRAGEEDLDPPLLARGRRSRAQGICGAAEDDADAADEERNRERRGDRPEGHRVGRPADDEHEDQPDVVGLPDRAHRVMRVLAQLPVAFTAAAQQLPEAGAEIGAAQDRVGSQSDEHEDDGSFSEAHALHPRRPAPRSAPADPRVRARGVAAASATATASPA